MEKNLLKIMLFLIKIYLYLLMVQLFFILFQVQLNDLILYLYNTLHHYLYKAKLYIIYTL